MVPSTSTPSAGVGDFRFRDRLIFGAVEENWSGPQYTPWQADSHSAYLNEDIANNLVGLQMGLNASWRFAGSLCSSRRRSACTTTSSPATSTPTWATAPRPRRTSIPGSSYPVHSTRNGFSVLTQVDVGLDWQFSCHWSARLGYRLVAATGMGMAEDQIPQYHGRHAGVGRHPAQQHVDHARGLHRPDVPLLIRAVKQNDSGGRGRQCRGPGRFLFPCPVRERQWVVGSG